MMFRTGSTLLVSEGNSQSPWRVQQPGYISALPGHGGYGMDSYGGSGRHTTPGNVTVFFLDDFTTGSTVSAAYPGGYTRILHGNMEGFVAAASPKICVPIKSGTVNMGNDVRPGSYMDFYGQFAPGDGVLFRATQPSSIVSFGSSTASHQRWWHLDCRIGDDASGIADEDRDAAVVGGYSTSGVNAPDYNVHINCCYGWSLDEIVDGYYGGGLLSFLYCAFIEPMHKSFHDDGGGIDMHGYGPILGSGYRFNKVSIQRCFFGHISSRQPSIAAISFAYANNWIYNPGDSAGNIANGIELHVDYDAASPYASPMYSNIYANMVTKGPDGYTSFNAVYMDPANQHPSGSQGYIGKNCVNGWAYSAQSDLMAGTFPGSWLQSGIVANAWPGSWGSAGEYVNEIGTATTPNGFSSAERIAFANLMYNSVGPCPGNRRSSDRAGIVLGHGLARETGSGSQGECVNSVAGTDAESGWPNSSLRFLPNAGGWPTISTVTETDPLGSPTYWHAPMPLNGTEPDDRILSSGTFSNGRSKVGYTAIEAWAIEEHLQQGGY